MFSLSFKLFLPVNTFWNKHKSNNNFKFVSPIQYSNYIHTAMKEIYIPLFNLLSKDNLFKLSFSKQRTLLHQQSTSTIYLYITKSGHLNFKFNWNTMD